MIQWAAIKALWACKGVAAFPAGFRRGMAAALLLALPVRAQTPAPSVCQAFADHITPDLVPNPLRLLAAQQGDFLHVMDAEHVDAEDLSAELQRAIAELAARDTQAANDLAPVIDHTSSFYLISFMPNDVSIIDVVGGKLYCPMLVGLAGVQAGDGHKVPMTIDPDCGVDVFGATIGGTPALVVDDEKSNSDDDTWSDLTISSLNREQFVPPCTVAVRYDVAFHGLNAFCQGVDCALVSQKAEAFVARREAGEDADTLGAGAIPVGAAQMQAGYQRLAALATGDVDPELPTFGSTVEGYNRFDTTIPSPTVQGCRRFDGTTLFSTIEGCHRFNTTILFPMSLEDGHLYIARLGHGRFGWRSTPDYLFAIYALDGDDMRPVAGVYLKAERTKIASVQVK